MKVWVVTAGDDYDSDCVQGVYTTKENALLAAEKVKSRKWHDHVEICTVEVDSLNADGVDYCE